MSFFNRFLGSEQVTETESGNGMREKARKAVQDLDTLFSPPEIDGDVDVEGLLYRMEEEDVEYDEEEFSGVKRDLLLDERGEEEEIEEEMEEEVEIEPQDVEEEGGEEVKKESMEDEEVLERIRELVEKHEEVYGTDEVRRKIRELPVRVSPGGKVVDYYGNADRILAELEKKVPEESGLLEYEKTEVERKVEELEKEIQDLKEQGSGRDAEIEENRNMITGVDERVDSVDRSMSKMEDWLENLDSRLVEEIERSSEKRQALRNKVAEAKSDMREEMKQERNRMETQVEERLDMLRSELKEEDHDVEEELESLEKSTEELVEYVEKLSDLLLELAHSKDRQD